MFSDSKLRGQRFIIYYKPLPPPGLPPLSNQESVLSIFLILCVAYLALLFILIFNLLYIFFEASLYLLKLKLNRCLCSVVNKDVDLLEHEHEEHEHEDPSEYDVFSVLFKDLFSGLFKDVLDKSSLIHK